MGELMRGEERAVDRGERERVGRASHLPRQIEPRHRRLRVERQQRIAARVALDDVREAVDLAAHLLGTQGGAACNEESGETGGWVGWGGCMSRSELTEASSPALDGWSLPRRTEPR